MSEFDGEIRVDAEELLELVIAVFERCGMSQADAALLADSLGPRRIPREGNPAQSRDASRHAKDGTAARYRRGRIQVALGKTGDAICELAPGVFSVDSRFVDGKKGIVIGKRAA